MLVQLRVENAAALPWATCRGRMVKYKLCAVYEIITGFINIKAKLRRSMGGGVQLESCAHWPPKLRMTVAHTADIFVNFRVDSQGIV